MKRTLLLMIAVIAIASTSFAVKHTVTVSNTQFTPDNLTIQLGDTVTWVWVNGAHTTTSTLIPGGITGWNSPIDNSVTTYSYKPPVAGTYRYVCTPHAPGMAGIIVVQNPTSVGAVSNTALSIYPNPTSSSVTIDLSAISGLVDLKIIDVSGRLVEKNRIDGGKKTEVSVSHLANGIYSLQAEGKGQTVTQRFTVAH